MIWIALALILMSFILSTIIKRRHVHVCADNNSGEIKTEKISPIIGLSAILVGTTIMIGYILVTYLGKLGFFLTETLKTWVG